VLQYDFRQIASLRLSHISTLSSLSNLIGLHIEELYLHSLENLTNNDILSYENFLERGGFPNLRKVSIEQCYSVVKVPCMKHICEVNVIRCLNFRNVESLLVDKEAEKDARSVWKLTYLTVDFFNDYLTISSKRYKSLKYLYLHGFHFSRDSDSDLSLLINIDSLVLISYSLYSELTLNYFNCRRLELTGFKFMQNVTFSTKLRKLSISRCIRFSLRCDNDNKENIGWKHTFPETVPTLPSRKVIPTAERFERFELMIPCGLYSFHLEEVEEIEELSMLGKVKHLELENLAKVKTLEGLGNGNESVYISRLPLVKDFSPLNGIYKVTLRDCKCAINESTLSRVRHLVVS
jgi:hypothetical protein